MRKVTDLFVVVLLVVVASVATIYFQLSFFYSTLLFFGAPSLYLVLRKPSIFTKAGIAAVIFGGIWGFTFDLIAELNRAWDWTTATGTVVPFKLLGVVTGDVMVWFLLWVFLAIAFYEYFIDGVHRKISRRALPIALTGIVVALLVGGLKFVAPGFLTFSYTYLWLGTMALIPFFYILQKDPKLIPKVFRVLPFFIFLYLSCEIVSLSAGLWTFPGQYIGTVTLLDVVIPLEEFFFWVIASSAVAVAYYEYAIDDEK